MLGKEPEHFLAGRQIEVGKVEARRDGAAAERPAGAPRDRRLPNPGGDDVLRALAVREVSTERQDVMRLSVEEVKIERVPVVMVPDLVGGDPVERREGSPAQQEIDRGRGRTRRAVRQTTDREWRAPRLAKYPPSGWGSSPRSAIQRSASWSVDTLQCYDIFVWDVAS